MADEPKRLSPAELRKQQEEREQAARAALAKEQEAARQRAAEHARAQLRAQIDRLKATWYDSVQAAAQRTGVRFVVIARVVSDAERTGELTEIMQAITAEKYECRVVSLQSTRQGGGLARAAAIEREEGEVLLGNERGWKPAQLPQFGANGVLKYLIVKW